MWGPKEHAMARTLRHSIIALAAMLVLGVAAPTAARSPSSGDPVIVRHEDDLLHGPASHTLGNPNGDVTIIEFFDYACPYCKAAEPRLEAFLKADRNVRLVVEEFPILTPASAIASRAALAADRQGKYAAFHQALMLYRGGLDEDAILGVAKDVGLNIQRLRRDMANPKLTAAIDANLKLAKTIGAHGTPTLIVDDRILTQPSATIDFPALAAASRKARERT
jgi:protein-disulfide isomerase